ncbi:DNA uptake protein ComE-like DNA-binding protein [Methylobacterium sp. PvP062]|jgi:DNA uptake protein ComE-like DNA-binding protein|nr:MULTISPECIES: helix-hairpin-helix domain-containing protein [Methylobacterium]MCX7333656.1 helix-hairpin-helix domain-containing protein [Hyphomicrobiales bacterium]MBP2498798.1 DNA uptake protein ComE-like DNA-binding protein [Methylobacterium sp. PvP105]MBP2505916.1 DNA uptake protein ComE-like DNA-binding protein [Methylobacterium sp. PvP109]MDE3748386.1 helix-hairpin-helix domain-containing protein [Methylobacterium radiotolerans]UIY45381.1 helix-hairpin-helix domain-containing protein 
MPPQPADSASGSGQPPASPGQGVDLNTASVEELNALGAGMIGRRIIAFRPYASPEDLVTRRVLKKADYEAIKAAVAVRQTDAAGAGRPD